MSEKPRWNGGFSEARRIAVDIVGDHLDDPGMLVDKIAETLVEAFDNGVLAEHCARHNPEAATAVTTTVKRRIFIELLREHGIGIATLEETEARMRAIARGEIKPAQDAPKLWFSSIEVFFGCIKRDNPLPDTNLE